METANDLWQSKWILYQGVAQSLVVKSSSGLIHIPPFKEDSCQQCAGGQGGGVLSFVDGIPDGIATTE